MCASVRVRMSVHACVRGVFAIYDDNMLSRLIMIIIKSIIIYFIEIRHTDDFPSAGIPASNNMYDYYYFLYSATPTASLLMALYSVTINFLSLQIKITKLRLNDKNVRLNININR